MHDKKSNLYTGPKSLATSVLCFLFKCCANIVSSYDKLVCAIYFHIPNRTSMTLFVSLFKYSFFLERKKKEKEKEDKKEKEGNCSLYLFHSFTLSFLVLWSLNYTYI